MEQAAYFDEAGLRSPFYRVSAKAIVRDDDGRVLVVADNTGTFELPGGGWEHDESLDDCLYREFKEELGVELASVGRILFAYCGWSTRRHAMLRIVAEATLGDHNFALDEDEVTQACFVGRPEFLTLNWCGIDRGIVEHVDQIWPPG